MLGEIEQFLYREAHLLDTQRYEEWLDLWTEDATYWVPLEQGQSDPFETSSIIHDDRTLLEQRVWAANAEEVIARYAKASDAARTRLGEPQTRRYGPATPRRSISTVRWRPAARSFSSTAAPGGGNRSAKAPSPPRRSCVPACPTSRSALRYCPRSRSM